MDRPISILHISGAQGWRGGEQQVEYLLKGINDNVSKSILLPANSRLHNKAKDIGITVHTFNGSRISGVLALQQALSTVTFDIIHLHDPAAHTLYSIASTFLTNIPPAVLHRRVDFETGKWFLSKWKYNLPAIRKIICVSQRVKDVLSPTIDDKEKLEVIHSGIDVASFTSAAASDIRNELDVPNNAILVGNVAALAEHKDHLTFIRTAELLVKRFPTAYFIIAGEGELKEAIVAEIESRDLAGRVYLLGFRANVPALLHSLDLFLYTSKEEGLGGAVIEAMAAGVPVVSTNAGGIPEIIAHGENGLLAEIGDEKTLFNSCADILSNTLLRDKLVQNGKIAASTFSYQRMTEEIVNLYKAVLSGDK